MKSPDSTKKNSEKKLYRCQHCKYVTDRKNNLKRHVVTMHEQCQKTLECCDVVFQNKVISLIGFVDFMSYFGTPFL